MVCVRTRLVYVHIADASLSLVQRASAWPCSDIQLYGKCLCLLDPSYHGRTQHCSFALAAPRRPPLE